MKCQILAPLLITRALAVQPYNKFTNKTLPIFYIAGTLLQVTLSGCDGGKHDDSSVPFNVLSHGNATGQTNGECL